MWHIWTLYECSEYNLKLIKFIWIDVHFADVHQQKLECTSTRTQIYINKFSTVHQQELERTPPRTLMYMNKNSNVHWQERFRRANMCCITFKILVLECVYVYNIKKEEMNIRYLKKILYSILYMYIVCHSTEGMLFF
jgi:hypothetical protein